MVKLPEPQVAPSTDHDEQDVLVAVTLPLSDYEQLRSMIDRDKNVNAAWRWFRSVLLVLAGGALTFWALGDKIIAMFPKGGSGS